MKMITNTWGSSYHHKSLTRFARSLYLRPDWFPFPVSRAIVSCFHDQLTMANKIAGEFYEHRERYVR